MEAKLRQAQKLEAVGSLAAGIAHEINTPIQFVGDNVRFMSQSFTDLMKLLQQSAVIADKAMGNGDIAQEIQQFLEAYKNADIDFVREEMPKAIEQTLDGVDRVATIVRAMKKFSHPDQGQKAPADINEAISNTLIVARNELKYVADVETSFAHHLPMVACHLSDLNQVFLNLFVNAAHAIADVVKETEQKGTITVRTSRDGDNVVVEISDTGCGIPEDIRDRIFDPFFTTKGVGEGTGQAEA